MLSLATPRRSYDGTYDSGLSYNSVCAIFATIAAVMIPVSILSVLEPAGGQHKRSLTPFHLTFELLSMPLSLRLIIFAMGFQTLSNVSTPAINYVAAYWVGVGSLQNSISQLLQHVCYAVPMLLVFRYFLATNWYALQIERHILPCKSLGLTTLHFGNATTPLLVRSQASASRRAHAHFCSGAPAGWATLLVWHLPKPVRTLPPANFDTAPRASVYEMSAVPQSGNEIPRSRGTRRYFFLFESIFSYLPSSMANAAMGLAIFELASSKNEGLAYACFSSALSSGTPIGRTVFAQRSILSPRRITCLL